MTFTYTELLKNASPLRGGHYAGMAMGHFGADGGAVANLISTTLASVVHVSLTTYGVGQLSSFVTTISTNGMIAISLGGACSGSWQAIGN